MEEIRVLIADDEKEIRDLVKKYLQRERYQVDTAADGEEALRLFERHKYNFLLLDLMMPKIDGIEVCRRLRNMTNIPILMLLRRYLVLGSEVNSSADGIRSSGIKA
jgi:DNA-binding response OmpR family regulator